MFDTQSMLRVRRADVLIIRAPGFETMKEKNENSKVSVREASGYEDVEININIGSNSTISFEES